MNQRVSGHFHQFSVHQLVIMRELVWKPFEIVDRKRADKLHKPYFNSTTVAPVPPSAGVAG